MKKQEKNPYRFCLQIEKITLTEAKFLKKVLMENTDFEGIEIDIVEEKENAKERNT